MRTMDEALEYQRAKMAKPGAAEALNQRILRALQKDGNLESAQWTCDPPPELSEEVSKEPMSKEMSEVVPDSVPKNDGRGHEMSKVCADCGKIIDHVGTRCYACQKRRQRDGR